MKKIVSALSLVVLSFGLWALMGMPALDALEERTESISIQARVDKNKEVLLSRLRRPEIDFRAKKGQRRIRWEWYDQVLRSYFWEKGILAAELSEQEKYALRFRWVYQDMEVTFQEIFQLGPEYDDVLVPILSHGGLLNAIPSSSFDGLTLLGKKGEVKGPFVRKFINRETSSSGRIFYPVRLEYKNKKGEVKIARGKSWDAFTLRWKDIKDRVADSVTLDRIHEDRRMYREARFPLPGE